jgi:hypothetical protein
LNQASRFRDLHKEELWILKIFEGSKEPIHLSLFNLRSLFLGLSRDSFLEILCREEVFGLDDAGFGFIPNSSKATSNFLKTSLLIHRGFVNFPS